MIVKPSARKSKNIVSLIQIDPLPFCAGAGLFVQIGVIVQSWVTPLPYSSLSASVEIVSASHHGNAHTTSRTSSYNVMLIDGIVANYLPLARLPTILDHSYSHPRRVRVGWIVGISLFLVEATTSSTLVNWARTVMLDSVAKGTSKPISCSFSTF